MSDTWTHKPSDHAVQCDLERFKTASNIEKLFNWAYDDFPEEYTFRTPDGLYLASCIEDDDETRELWYVASKVMQDTLNALESGQISIRDCLLSGELFLLGFRYGAVLIASYEVTVEYLEKIDALPDPRTMIRAKFEKGFNEVPPCNPT